jgi:hypothetical protein
MITVWRRLRRAVLRVAFNRVAATLAGLVLAGAAAVVAWVDFAWESALTDGLVLIAGATGVAFLVIAITGRSPDWIE